MPKPAIRLGNEGRGEGVIEGIESDLSPRELEVVVADLAGEAQIVGGDDECGSLSLGLANDADECTAIGLVEAVEGFIKEDEVGSGDECARNENSLTLPAREVAEAVICAIG